MKINKKYSLVVSFLLALMFIQLSFNHELWIDFWKSFNVPPQIPPFADLDAISRALKSKLDGFDPYYNNPYDITKKPYTYTSLWLYIFELLGLDLIRNFQIFSFIILFFYIYFFIQILNLIDDSKIRLFLILLFFSTSNLLAIERLNTDIIIFIMIYLMSISNNYLIKLGIFFFSIYAKLFPIFAVFVFSTKMRMLISAIVISLFLIFSLRHEINLMLSNGLEYALLSSHGIPSITRGFWYYSTKFNYFIDDSNYLIFKYFIMSIASLYGFIIFKLSFKFQKKKLSQTMSIEDSLYICGSGIYLGRFITFGNFDYALIFLIFTIPYFLKNTNLKIRYIYFFTLFICFNSLIFEGGARYDLIYFTKASLIHFLKIVIFTINCFYFGKVLNSYINVKIKYIN